MKFFSKMIDGLKSKWLKNTGKTAILIAIIIIIFLAINVGVQTWDPKDFDLSSDQLYSLTEESKERISSLPEEDKFEIYLFDYKETDTFVDFVKQYKSINDNITIEILKTDDRPDLVSKYNIEEGYYTVLIICGEKYKVLTTYDFYTYDSEGNTVDLTEQRLTNSLIVVSSIGKSTPVYVLTGHGEYDPTTEMALLQTYIELENYEMKTLNLLSEQKVPEDCKDLMIASPTKDITDLEAKAIKEYIERGGNIIWLNDPYSAKSETPFIKSILDLYGVTIRQDGIVVEQDTSKIAMGSPDVIMPTIQNNNVVGDIQSVVLFGTGKLEFLGDDKLLELGVTKTDILTTGEKSFFRTNLEITDYAPVDGEKEESSVVGALLEKSVQDGQNTSKLVVFASNAFITDKLIYTGSSQAPAVALLDNRDLILNTIQYNAEIEDPITIRKQAEVTRYTATETQDRIIKIIIYIIPILIIILGIIIWQLRRRKK